MLNVFNTGRNTKLYAKRLAIVVGFFHCFRLLTGAIAAIFFLNSGMALADLAILQMVFSTTLLVINYPVGILCDKYGGKYFAYSACLIISFFYLLCTFAPNLHVLMFAHFLNSIGLSFIGCAVSTWLVSLTNAEDHQVKNYINYLGHLSAEIEAIGGIISGLLGAMLVYAFYGRGYVYVFYITSLLMFSLSFVVLSIPSSYAQKIQRENKKIIQIVKLNLNQIIHNREILFFLLTSSAMTVLYQPIYHFWQPYFAEFAVAKIFDESVILGLCFSLFSLSKYIFNTYVKAMLLKNDNIDLMRMSIILTTLVIPMFYCIAINSNSFILGCILFCALHGSLSLISRIIGGQYLKTTKEDSAASIVSLGEIIGRIITTCYFACLYKVLPYMSVKQIFYISCLVALVILVGLLGWKKSINNSDGILLYKN